MKIKYLYTSVVLLSLVGSGCKVKSYYGNNAPIDHSGWTALLQEHVNEDGWVDYEGIVRDSDKLSLYLNTLESNHPNPETWSKEERLAYWINAYNAFTVKLIVDNYPVESIKDIKKGIPFISSVWDIEFIRIEGQNYTLNNIEHGILRPKFEEPRIHFAINCASYSCPVLRSEAYTADRLEDQLTEAAKLFISDTRRNQISSDTPQLSKIFSWFKGDFTNGRTLIEFVNQYSETQIRNKSNIEFLDYDWKLNDVQ